MLSSITWGLFIKIILVLAGGYYAIILLLFYRHELRRLLRSFLFSLAILLGGVAAQAQSADGNNGLSQANTMVRGYFDTATQLMYAVGAIVGLVGAIRIITTRHRDDMGKEIAIWFGSCIFLVVVATVLKSFFGL